MKNLLRNPLVLRVVVLLLSALGGWLAGQYPSEMAALCRGGVHDPLR